MVSTEDDELSSDCEKLSLDTSTKVPVRKNHRTRDITREFSDACKALSIGDLVQDGGFSLFDSVQALEIMDPKMDTGFLKPGESLDDDYDVCRELLPAEVIWIMDQLICYEMAWHQGYPLAQNLLTSMYMYNLLVQDRLPNAMPFFRPLDGSSKEPGPLVQKVLRAFCVGIIKTCDVVVEVIQTQQYYEEEDFNTHSFGLNLLTDIPDDEVIQTLDDARDWLFEPEIQRSIGPENILILMSHLSSRILFLNLILLNPLKEGHYAPEDEKAAFKETLVTGMQSSECHRRPVEEAFSGKLQRRLASSVPPRPIIYLDISTASREHYKMYEDIQEALRADQFGRKTSLETLCTFLWAFSAREPSAFARGMLQIFLFNEGKVAGLGDGIQGLLIRQIQDHLVDSRCLKENFWNVEAPTDQRFQIARAVDFFLEQASPEYMNVLRCLCQNRCRIRRCLANVVTDVDKLRKSFANFVVETADPTLEGAFSSTIKTCLYACIKLFLLFAAQSVVEVGFEQDIYQPFEYATLNSYLAKLDDESIEICSGVRQKAFDNAAEIELYTKRPLKATDKREWNRQSIWKGLAVLNDVLNRLGAIPPPKTPYCSVQSQLELRMRPFKALIHGAHLNYPYAEDAALEGPIKLGDLLKRSGEMFLLARNHLKKLLEERLRKGLAENLEEGITEQSAAFGVEHEKGMLKACVKASVAVETLKRALEAIGGNEEKLIGKVHATFEAPRLGCFWLVPTITVSLDD